MNFCILFLGFSLFLFFPNNSFATLPNCATLTAPDPDINCLLPENLPNCSTLTLSTAQPGKNCFFNDDYLPLCNTFPNPIPSYVIPERNILSSNITASHRNNCYNLSDLPLCDTVQLFTAVPTINCVNNCNSYSFTNNPVSSDYSSSYKRGEDYAVHNRDCIRFEDEINNENAGVIATTISNATDATVALTNVATDYDHEIYVKRKAHQISNVDADSADSTLYDRLPCNDLTPDELIALSTQIAADDAAGNDISYCSGGINEAIETDQVKCYEFSEAQLPYTFSGDMCTIHDCQPTCSDLPDDTINISNQGTSYVTAYISSINAGGALSNTSICNPMVCKPTFERHYACINSEGERSEDDDDANSLCDDEVDEGNGSSCSTGYCYKTINCNDTANVNEPECDVASGDDDTIGSIEDITDAWFYRPKPLEKATDRTGDIRTIKSMKNNKICYKITHMRDHDWGGDAGLLGYFHSAIWPDETRSPGHCTATKKGDRGTGYVYLCYGDANPNAGQLYAKIYEQSVYHKGYVETTFTNGYAEHKIRVCLRFRNAERPDDTQSETCGKRLCGITCSYGNCHSQQCGKDVCRTLKITEDNPDECKMQNSLFSNNNSTPCTETVDDYLRLRIQQYGNKICTFLDVKGQTAYEPDFFAEGNETLAPDDQGDYYCIDGSKAVSGTSCSGYNTNDDKWSAARWRTISFGSTVHVPYISNNQPAGQEEGYIDRDGRFFEAQDCMKISSKLPPPDFYNVGTNANSPKLFNPPIYIVNARTTTGGGISAPLLNTGDTFGYTDFNTPEIEVRFGTELEKFSLAVGDDGSKARDDSTYDDDSTSSGDSTDASDTGLKKLTTTLNDVDYTAELFVEKNQNSSSDPTFCLYQKIFDSDNVEQNPLRINCVNRFDFSTGNTDISTSSTTSSTHKLVVSASANNTYDDSEINFQYLTQSGSDDTNICGSDDTCTIATTLSNPDITLENCDSSTEGYNVCAKRDPCTALTNECMQNEIDLHNAAPGSDLTTYISKRKACNNDLLPSCNKKKGLTDDAPQSVINDPLNAVTIGNAYGWFNELCLTSGSNSNGFNYDLRNVIAYELPNNVMGKCLINPLSPHVLDPTKNCDDGGKAPDCVCVEESVGYLPAGTKVRLETKREAGFCVDIPAADTCAPIDYTPSNPTTDPNYVTSSLGFTSYGDESGYVHTSHYDRQENLQNGLGHAEFPIAVMGMIDVSGTCNGFWKENSSGPPLRSCLNNTGTTTASWGTSIKNACVRFNCPKISTSGPTNASATAYNNGYGANEIGENKGASNGFATWKSYTKTNDFTETVGESVGESECIDGFKEYGSIATTADGSTAGAGDVIASYTSGGTPPIRECNQTGIWGAPDVSRICQRISCPAVNPPSDPSDYSDWLQWYEAGGATFNSILASRSRVYHTSVATGTCNNDAGFFKVSDVAPTRRCDYLGNWSDVINPCTTKCEEIYIPNNNSNDGFASWSESLEGKWTANACSSGYFPYPYPPFRNPDDGNLIPLKDTDWDPSYITSIPSTITDDARFNSTPYNDTSITPPLPERSCKPFTTASGITTNVWYASSSQCVDFCPGADFDPRLGVGKTRHNTRSGKIFIEWDNTDLGTWTSKSSSSGQKASLYSSKDRINNHYVVARKCGSNGKWEDPIPQCVISGDSAKGGIIGTSNAYYNSTQTSHPASGTIDVTLTGEEYAVSTQCIGTNYFKTGYDGSATSGAPITKYSCQYSDTTTKNIDQTYFQEDSDPSTKDCQAYCIANSSTDFGTEQYYDSTSTIYMTFNSSTPAQLNLTCNVGYGKSIVGAGSGGDDSCGRLNTNRTNLLPSVICTTSGWSSVVNACDACQSCTNGDSVYANSANSVGDHRKAPSRSIVDKGSLTFKAYSSGAEKCGSITIEDISVESLIGHCTTTGTSVTTANESCAQLGAKKTKYCDYNRDKSKVRAYVRVKCLDGEFTPHNCPDETLTTLDCLNIEDH